MRASQFSGCLYFSFIELIKTYFSVQRLAAMAASFSPCTDPTLLALLNCASSSAQAARRRASQDFRCFVEAHHDRSVAILTRPRLLNIFFIIFIIRTYMRLVVCSSQRNSIKNRVPVVVVLQPIQFTSRHSQLAAIFGSS